MIRTLNLTVVFALTATFAVHASETWAAIMLAARISLSTIETPPFRGGRFANTLWMAQSPGPSRDMPRTVNGKDLVRLTQHHKSQDTPR